MDTIGGFGWGKGSLTWTSQRIEFEPGFLQFTSGHSWRAQEISDIQVGKGQPLLPEDLVFWIVTLIVLPVLAVITLGIGLAMFVLDRFYGTYLIVTTPSGRRWFFLKSVGLDEAMSALDAFAQDNDLDEA